MTIAIDNLNFSYGSMAVLRGINASAARARITAVLGPNAAGKSTLLRCIIGALKPTSGAALIDGAPVHHLSARAIAQRIAYVPQRAIVSAAFTVRQVIELGRYALTANPRRVDQAIMRLDVRDIEHRPYRELSVGQQQRVTLTRAIAQLEPAGHFILDEPASAMDLRHAADCFGLLREIATGGATVVIAMHDISAAAAIADDVWLLNQGRLVAAGPSAEVMTPARLESVFGVDFQQVQLSTGESRLIASI